MSDDQQDMHKRQKEVVAQMVPLVNRYCFDKCVRSPQKSFSVEQEHCLST